MIKSESIVKLSAALARAQAEMPSVPMNQVNPFLKNKFADLGACIETARPVLAKYGLALAQFPMSDGGNIGLTNLLTHESGEWIEETVFLFAGDEKGKSLAQVAGSVITYLRRYSMTAILGMFAEEDADGNQKFRPADHPIPEKLPDAPAELTLEQAEQLVNSENIKYGDLPTEKLAFVANNAKAPALKRKAASLILQARAKKDGK